MAIENGDYLKYSMCNGEGNMYMVCCSIMSQPALTSLSPTCLSSSPSKSVAMTYQIQCCFKRCGATVL